MQIIGHRGAAGLALENTLESIKKAVELKVDGIEFDVRLTRDRELVLCHDEDLSRVSLSKGKIDRLDLRELKTILLKNGETVPTLREALKAVGKITPVIEVKVSGCAKELIKILDEFPRIKPIIASFKRDVAKDIKDLRPTLPVYLAGFTSPWETFRAVKNIKANGLDFNAWALSQITYRLAKRAGLKMMVYTINQLWIAKFINRFYPDVAIITDFPDKLMELKKHES